MSDSNCDSHPPDQNIEADMNASIAGSEVWTSREEVAAQGTPHASPLDREETEARNPIDLLANEFAERIRNGESPSIEDYVQRLPDHEAAIRVLFPSIEMMERVSEKEHAENQVAETTTGPAGQVPNRLGDFAIIREIGRGGMGVVYEAQQLSLCRRVALKVVIPSSSPSQKVLERFRREAEAAARLHHTNIVPVFGYGEQNGFHFFAMQLIDGTPLNRFVASARVGDSLTDESDELISANPDSGISADDRSSIEPDARDTSRPSAALTEVDREQGTVADERTADFELSINVPVRKARPRTPVYYRKMALIVRDVASALSYAHLQGVLHRDVKPANLLLDQDENVWVTDFGLARHEDHDDLTKTGDMVGTLRYMAPEQFNGDADARSDICALGLTLFELLTQQPACSEMRQAALVKARTETPPPSPRSVDPSIPIELDTIAQKAAALSPADRYQTAAELADDLQRFLDDRPISARRLVWHERLLRWTRRNPTVAALSLTAICLLVATAVTFAVGQHRTELALEAMKAEESRAQHNLALANGNLTLAENNLKLANSNLALAENNLSMAIQAFEEIFARLESRGVSQSFAANVGEGELAAPHSVLTNADVELLELLLQFFDRFATENQSETTRLEAVEARKRVGDIQQRLGRFDDAAETYRQTIKLYAALREEQPDQTRFVVAQAALLNELGVAASQQAAINEAIMQHRSASELLIGNDAVAQTEAGRFELARTWTLLSSVSQRAGVRSLMRTTGPPGPRGGTEQLPGPPLRNARPGTAAMLFRMFPARGPRSGGGEARTEVPFGVRMRRRREEALDACQSAIELLTELIQDYPSNSDHRLWLARTHRSRAEILALSPHREEAVQAWQSAIDELNLLSEEYPEESDLQFELADTLCLKISDSDESGDAVVNVVQAIDISHELSSEYPNSRVYQALRGKALFRLANLQAGSGDHEAAAEQLKAALQIQRSLAARFPEVTLYRIACAETLDELARAEEQLGMDKSAADHLNEAIFVLEEAKISGYVERTLDRFVDGFINQLHIRWSRLQEKVAPIK